MKNFIDDKWYYFDDSRVSLANPENSVVGSAYLLFYLRRGSLNKPSKIKSIIDETRIAYENQMWEIYIRQEDVYINQIKQMTKVKTVMMKWIS